MSTSNVSSIPATVYNKPVMGSKVALYEKGTLVMTNEEQVQLAVTKLNALIASSQAIQERFIEEAPKKIREGWDVSCELVNEATETINRVRYVMSYLEGSQSVDKTIAYVNGMLLTQCSDNSQSSHAKRVGTAEVIKKLHEVRRGY